MSELLTSLWVRVSNALYREQGQALTEYALVLSILAGIVGLLAFKGIGGQIVGKIQKEIDAIVP
jgi:hypothetical protein